MNKYIFKYCIILILLFLLFPTTGSAQKKITDQQAHHIIAMIRRSTAGIRQMTCDFTQTSDIKYLEEKSVSKGNMTYVYPDRLCWKYTSPYSFTFAISGNKITTQSGHHRQTYNIAGNQLYQKITRIMMNTVSGKSLQGNYDFSMALYQKEGNWITVLTPKRGDYQKVFKSIRLYFNTRTHLISRISIQQRNLDKVTIQLQNVKASYRQ